MSATVSPPRLTAAERRASARWIISQQGGDGLIPWFVGGHGDPWNHLEAAMALTVAGEIEAARAALSWSLAHQRPDGAWHAAYASNGEVLDERLDTNFAAYLATAAAHHYVSTGDGDFVRSLLPALEAALEFVLRNQLDSGAVAWESRVAGGATFALLAASSSVHHSLGSALLLAGELGFSRPHWERACGRLGSAIRLGSSDFADKAEFAMDWYYPVLAGVLPDDEAGRRLDAGWKEFVLPAGGVRCRSDRSWVTTAETAETALACARLGLAARADALLAATRAHRLADGSYVTGRVHPEGHAFPEGERTTYSVAAVLLADDVRRGGRASGRIFAPGAQSRRSRIARLRQRVPGGSTKRPVPSASR